MWSVASCIQGGQDQRILEKTGLSRPLRKTKRWRVGNWFHHFYARMSRLRQYSWNIQSWCSFSFVEKLNFYAILEHISVSRFSLLITVCVPKCAYKNIVRCEMHIQWHLAWQSIHTNCVAKCTYEDIMCRVSYCTYEGILRRWMQGVVCRKMCIKDTVFCDADSQCQSALLCSHTTLCVANDVIVTLEI